MWKDIQKCFQQVINEFFININKNFASIYHCYSKFIFNWQNLVGIVVSYMKTFKYVIIVNP